MLKNPAFIAVFLLAVILISITGPICAQAKPPLFVATKRQQFRNEFVKFETIIDALDIKEGMTILDIGSGPGFASFLFAEKLNGSGAVFATDIRQDFVTSIAEEAERRGLTNLFSALVKEESLDEFYSLHRYDLVFLSNVYHVIEDRVWYFEKLREFLKPGARLVVVFYNQVPLFSEDDLTDIDTLIDIFTREDKDSTYHPFVQQLSNATRKILANKTNRNAIASALVDDFNRMLADPHFFENFYKNSYFKKNMFTVPEREFANWLLMTIKEEGVLDKSAEQIDAKAMRSVIKLNRLFFKNLLGEYLANGGMGAYIPAGDANRHTSKYIMLHELNAAGYRLVDEIKISPYFDTIILTPMGITGN